jgi:hypothetical protein
MAHPEHPSRRPSVVTVLLLSSYTRGGEGDSCSSLPPVGFATASNCKKIVTSTP